MSDTKQARPPRELPELEFDEAAYLTAFPKVLDSLQSGRFKSAREHYEEIGRAQDRLRTPAYHRAMESRRLIKPETVAASPATPAPAAPGAASAMTAQLTPFGVDAVVLGAGGYVLVVGWVDDRNSPLRRIVLHAGAGEAYVCTAFARCRRADAELAVGAVGSGHLLGFWAVLPGVTRRQIGRVELGFDGHETQAPVTPRLVDEVALRDSVFEYLAGAQYFGNYAVDAAAQLDSGTGDTLIALNGAISRRVRNAAHVERFGPRLAHPRASIIVCLYGKVEYFFIQQALFSACADAQAYEYVFVCNSPELTEALLREAAIAAQIYGLCVTLVLLPGNAGFGAANNAAVAACSSQRVIICNPDVFPHSKDWFTRHSAVLSTCPPEQTAFFGVPLFYDDGALMHAGMWLDCDFGLSSHQDGFTSRSLLRVEHYGKGAPPNYAPYRQTRPVPAVTGALISADRATFERLGGFSEAYVFGHYEDADLCMQVWRSGGQVWLHDLPMWHLEGKGSVRRRPHEGGSLLNRWHFTRTWLAMAQDGMLGRAPRMIAGGAHV